VRAGSTARARGGQDQTSLYQEITDKIITELEAGRVPWVQRWETAAAKAPLATPKNAATQRRYSGVNVLILWGLVYRARLRTQIYTDIQTLSHSTWLRPLVPQRHEMGFR